MQSDPDPKPADSTSVGTFVTQTDTRGVCKSQSLKYSCEVKDLAGGQTCLCSWGGASGYGARYWLYEPLVLHVCSSESES